jgi:hypothetical protein
MAATLSAGVNSVILKLDTPYDTIRTTDIRDDLIKVKVWCSTTTGFTPSDSNKVFDALSLSIVISKLADGTDLVAGTPYFVKYAYISSIDETIYTVSSQLTTTPIVASAQTVDISGYSSFVKSITNTFTPATATLTAVINGITSPVYAWTITGGTLSATNTATVTVTPSTSATSVSVTLSVTGAGLTTPISKTIVMAVIADGIQGYSPPAFYINNYGSTFRKDVSGSIYPSTVIIETGYSNFKVSPAPTFQWQKDGVNISGATSFSYTVPSSDYSASTSHVYSCTVSGTDLAGAAKSITSSTTIPLISDGSTGPRTATGYLYYQTAVATDPGTPAASNYNFSTGQFGTLTNGWGYSPISPSTTNTSLKAWAARYSVIEPSYGTATGAASISATSPSISFDGIVTFSNNSYQTSGDVNTAISTATAPYQTSTQVNSAITSATANKLEAGATLNNALALNTTVIDGGRITTGIISAARLDLSGVLTATSVSNTGTTTIDGGRIGTGTITAARLDLSGVLKVGSTNGDGSVNTTTTINGGSIQTGSINANRLTIGQTTSVNRIRLYDNKIEIWAERFAGDTQGARRVVLGDLS